MSNFETRRKDEAQTAHWRQGRPVEVGAYFDVGMWMNDPRPVPVAIPMDLGGLAALISTVQHATANSTRVSDNKTLNGHLMALIAKAREAVCGDAKDADALKHAKLEGLALAAEVVGGLPHAPSEAKVLESVAKALAHRAEAIRGES